MNSKQFNELPSDVRDAAHRGLGSPPDSGAPQNPEDAVRHYAAGQAVRWLIGDGDNVPLPLSSRAKTAPDATEHSGHGPYPPKDPNYVR